MHFQKFMKDPFRFPLLVILAGVLLAVVGCNTSTKKKDYQPTMARFLIEASEGDAFASVTLPVSGVQIAVNNKPVVTEFDFTGVEMAETDLGKLLVFMLTPDATRDVYRVTGSNQGRRLVLFVNGRALGARMIDRPFNTGSIAIYVAVSDELMPELVKNLNATSVDIQKEIAKNKD